MPRHSLGWSSEKINGAECERESENVFAKSHERVSSHEEEAALKIPPFDERLSIAFRISPAPVERARDKVAAALEIPISF